jgi:hypothetical protein
MGAWQLPLNQIEATASKCAKFMLRHRGEAPAPDSAATIRALQAKIGQLTMECDFLEGALNKTGLGSAKR